jgi:hypothetical protein
MAAGLIGAVKGVNDEIGIYQNSFASVGGRDYRRCQQRGQRPRRIRERRAGTTSARVYRAADKGSVGKE